MLAWQTLLVLSAVAANGDGALLQFTSNACPACKTVQPVVARLAAEGYPVLQVNVDEQPEMARQYQIRAVPTFVTVSGGQPVGRLEGASTYDRLLEMMRSANIGPNGSSGPAKESMAPSTSQLQPTEYRGGFAAAPPTPAVGGNGQGNLSPMQRAMYATVRLKVEDGTGFGYGTGTVIDRHEGEALVVTCGHLFRQSQGKGKITADLFAPGAQGPVEGQLIAYDLDRDIALVSIRPNIELPVVPVGGVNYGVKPHDPAFSIGCDKGADASIRETKITAVNKYKGPPNVCAAGQPVDGRSGGGLFSAEGVLIGICNAADPQDDEGLYAALGSIHWQLDQIGQTHIYRRDHGSAIVNTSMETPVNPGAIAPQANALPAMPPRMPSAGLNPANSLAAVHGPGSEAGLMNASNPPAAPPMTVGADDVELIMIVRSKSNPQRQSQIMVLDNASPQLIQQLASGARPAGLSSQDVQAAAGGMIDAGRTALRNTFDGTVVRGQGE